MKEEGIPLENEDNMWKGFIKVLGEAVVCRLQEIEREVDWERILSLPDEEVRREALKLREDLASLQRIIKGL